MRRWMVLCVLLLTASLVTAGMEWKSITDVPEGYIPSADPSAVFIAPPGGSDALTFYTDLSTFETAHSGLVLEDWSNTLIGPGILGGPEPGPWDYLTNNSCFAPGGIAEGVDIAVDGTSGNNEVLILTAPWGGLPRHVVGPNYFSDGTYIGFFNFPTRAFGVQCHSALGGTITIQIEVFGTSGSLGTTSTSATLAGVFWGVYSDDEDIDYIQFVTPDAGIYGELQFGYGLPLARTTWGAIKQIY